MVQADALHQLIHSLSKTEKKYFKDFSRQGKYILLFDAINNERIYDEQKLLKRFAKEPFVKNIAVAKNYLYESILRSLRSYYSGKLIDDVSYEKLQNLKLLYEKGLSAKIEMQLQKLKGLCYDYELYPRLLEVITFETTLNNTRAKPNTGLFDERMKILTIMSNTAQINQVYEQLLQIALKHEYVSNTELNEIVEGLIKNPLLANQSQFRSRDEFYSLYNVFFVYHYLHRNYLESYRFKRRQFELYRDNQAFIKTRPKAHLLMAANMVSMAYNIPDACEFESCYNELLHLHKQVSGYDGLKFEQRISFGLLLCKMKEDYSALEGLMEDMRLEMDKHLHNITFVREMDIYFNSAVAWFKHKDFGQALTWLNKLLNHPRIEERQQVHRHARLLELVIHFELKNFKLISYKIVTTYRYLYKRQTIGAFDKALLTGMKQILRSADKYSLKSSLKKMASSLKEIPQAEYEKISNDQFDYLLWLEEKIKTI